MGARAGCMGRWSRCKGIGEGVRSLNESHVLGFCGILITSLGLKDRYVISWEQGKGFGSRGRYSCCKQ